MSTIKAINLQHPSSASNNLVLDNSGNATVANNATVSGNITVTGTGSVGGNFSFNSGYGSVATAYGCRAWVNFNGTGTVAIRASGNVSSITDHAVGQYTVNFTNAMPDTNYSIAMTVNNTPASGIGLGGFQEDVTAPATGSVRVGVVATGASGIPVSDYSRVSVAVFR